MKYVYPAVFHPLIKKTLNIPSWLNGRAEAANINFSQTLQKALKKELQLTTVE